METKKQRHGDFSALPQINARCRLTDAKVNYPEAFTDRDPAPEFPEDTVFGVELETGALQVTIGTIIWIYFPGEGWDGY